MTTAFSCTDVSEIPKPECEALVALYESTDGDNWTNNTGWLTTNTPCSWAGTVCVGGHVTQLRLSSNELSGTIPSQLGNLTNLTILHLHVNKLSGTIPSELGNLTNLTDLYLLYNELSGTIPSELGNLTNLTHFLLSNNQLSGTIPSELGNLTNLTHFGLTKNQLSGTIPSELGNLTNLIDLRLDFNQLSGTIPSELGNLTNLTILYLHVNELNGTIPSELGNLTNLTALYLYYNELSGTIPSELGNLTNLTQFLLAKNQLSDTIPSELGNLTNLTVFSLNDNQLSGTIPSELGNLTNLIHFSLNNNQLSGSIPSELGNLTNLTICYLQGNQLSGTIPSELGNLTSLTILYLQDNELSGTIPLELGNLTNLTHFLLSNNQLSGIIPSELGNLTNVTYLYLYSNQLSGDIPSTFGNLTSLTNLFLHENQLSGIIPSELRNLTNLINLYLEDNHLTGAIPPGLGNLTNLKDLRLEENKLSGNIPPELGNLTNLTYINLGLNDLSGSVPSEICQATQLDNLYIYANDGLTGPLPSCMADLSPSALDFSGTDICEPRTEAFQGWLDSIEDVGRTNILCDAPTLNFLIAASTPTAHAGDSITYNFIISATGESAAVTLTNTLPSELSDIQDISGATYDAANHRILYQGVITPGMPHTIAYTSKLAQDLTPGTAVLNTALLSGMGLVRERSAAVAVESEDPQTLVLVYGIGDNNLSGEMLRAINNAEQAAGNPAINIRYLLDGPGADDTYIFNLEADQNPICPNYTNVTCGGRYVLGQNLWKWTDNTASPHSLAEFISSSIHAYPNAAAVYVVIAGHGNGWGPNVLPPQPRPWKDQPDPLGGFLTDDHPHGFLSTRAFGAGMEWAYQASGRKIDLLYMDACSMGQLEVAYEIRDAVSSLLASESTSWASFPYGTMFNVIDGVQDANEIGQSWLKIESDLLHDGGYPFTLSLVDLGQMSQLLEAQSALSDQLKDNLSDHKSKIVAATEETECFDSDYNGSHASSADNYCDLHSFANNVAAEFQDEIAIVTAAESVNAALADAVVSQEYAGGVPWVYSDERWDWHKLGGLSIYLPFQEDEWKRKYYTRNHLSSARDGRWDELIHAFWSEDTEVEEPTICTVDDCEGLGRPLAIHPELQTPDYITVTRDSTASVPIDLASYSYHLVDAAVDVTFDTSCLRLADVRFNLPVGFTGEYNVVGGNTIAVAVSTAATPKPALLDDTIATLDFTVTCSASITFTNALFEDSDQNSLDGLANNTQVHVIGSSEIILDNNDTPHVVITGDWVSSTYVKPFYEDNYLHDDDKLKGDKSVLFLPEIPTACKYQVDMYWTAWDNRATNVPVDIRHATGTETVYVNQQIDGSQWNPLGVYVLSPGAQVKVRTDNTDGAVIVDAMRFTPLLPCTELTIPMISIRPQYDTVILSSSSANTITVDFFIQDIADFYAGQIVVEYDNTILEAIDFDDTKPGPQLEHGDLLPHETVIRNAIDQANGRIEYSISRQGDVPGVNGSGLFARAYFRVIGDGVSPLNFTYSTFSTSLPKPIPVSLQNSQIEIIENTVNLTGNVTLKDQVDSSGISVCVAENCTTTDVNGTYILEGVPVRGAVVWSYPGYVRLTQGYAGTAGETLTLPETVLSPLAATTLSLSGIVTDTHATENHGGIAVCLNGDCTQTEADGSYEFTNVPITGTITYAKAHYLTATVIYAGAAGIHIDLPGIEMRGGDVNQDGEVSDDDATIIGRTWGSSPGDPHWDARADLYQDNIIDVTDMTFVQRNWREESETFYVGSAAPRRVWAGVRASARNLHAMAQNSANVWVKPTQRIASSAGEEITADILVRNAVGVYSFNVVLNFDPAILKVRSQDDLRVGEFLDPLRQFVVVNNFDNEEGYVELMITQLYPAESRSGDGLLGAVLFESIAAGDGNIHIAEAGLLDNSTPDPVNISMSVGSGMNTYLPLIFRE